MNTKIKELKISNYKRKINSDYYFLNINNIYHGDEDELNNLFCKMAVNSDKSIVKEFGFYSIENGFQNEYQEFEKAIIYFQDRARELFLNREMIVFNLKYNDEFFRLECIFDDFISYFNEIKFFDETIFLFDKERTKHIALLRMEYCYEVVLFHI